MKSLERVYYSK